MMYLIEFQGAIDAAGTLQTFRYSTQGYQTKGTDTPAHTPYPSRIVNAGSYKRQMYADSKTYGVSSVSYGVIELDNINGGLDFLVKHGFDGRSLKILAGEKTTPYASLTTVLIGTMEQIPVGYTTAQIILKDKQLVLDRVLCANRYAGSNALPNGIEGTAELKGKPKPRGYGATTQNISPPCINTTRLEYQVNDGAVFDVTAVYDRGNSLNKGADYTSQADMEANAPAGGFYRVWKAGGIFRIGSSQTGLVTCDCQVSNTIKTVAQVLKQIALDMGIIAGEISSADVTALDTLNSAPISIWVNDESTALQVMDKVAETIGAWFGFDRLGVLRMGRLEVPSGSSNIIFDNSNIDDRTFDLVRSNDTTKGLPSYRITLNYNKNYTVQTTDLAGAVTDARRAVLSMEYQAEKAEDVAVKTKYLTSPEIIRNSCFVNQSDATTEASRLLTLNKTLRTICTVKVNLTLTDLAAIDIGVEVKCISNRFDMATGKYLRIMSIVMDLSGNTPSATMTLWG